MAHQDLAYCGLDCAQCPVFLATTADDAELRRTTAREWSERYAQVLGQALAPDDMQCRGCRRGGDEVFVGCRACPIKACCAPKGYATCAECEAYESCGMLSGFFEYGHEQAKRRLDELRHQGRS